MKILCCNLITYLYTTSVQISPSALVKTPIQPLRKQVLLRLLKKPPVVAGGLAASLVMLQPWVQIMPIPMASFY